MATNVIHGTGKPRFVLPTEELLDYYLSITDTVASATIVQIVLTTITEAQINYLDDNVGLKGISIWSRNTSNEDTWAVIQSFTASTKTFIVDVWSNGTPDTGELVEFKGRIIDLPYCQRLTESFEPDYIVKKMLDGRYVYLKRGFYYRASLDYGRYLHKDEMQIIRYLYEVTMNGCGFYPRKDNPAVIYTVDIDPESPISFYQLQSHQGHGGVVININGITRLNRIPFNDPVSVVTDAPTAGDETFPTADDGSYPTP